MLDLIQHKPYVCQVLLSVFRTRRRTGKCSHGGGPDQTSTLEPRGGINKDTYSASHGHLHSAAARVATAATAELLADVARAAGDTDFLR